MRRTISIFAATSLSLASVSALAEGPPIYSALPRAHIAAAPERSAMPAHVTGHPRVEGVFVATPSKEEQRSMASAGYRQVQVFTSERRAKDASLGRFSGDEEEGDACLLAHEEFGGGDGWSPSFMTQASVSVSRPTAAQLGRRFGNPQQQGGIEAVRFERLVREGGKVTLDGTTALIDPDTAGVKVFERSVVPLALVATGPAGVEVYAARDEGVVHFVVTPPKTDKIPDGAASFVRQTTRRLMAQLPGAFRNGHSDCGHFRTTLSIEKGSGQMVSVQATTLTPSDEPQEASPDDGMSTQMRALRAMKKRALLVHLSVSQSSTDKEPVLSVAFAWAGKESDQPF